jgi:hypothetical protein
VRDVRFTFLELAVVIGVAESSAGNCAVDLRRVREQIEARGLVGPGAIPSLRTAADDICARYPWLLQREPLGYRLALEPTS